MEVILNYTEHTSKQSLGHRFGSTPFDDLMHLLSLENEPKTHEQQALLFGISIRQWHCSEGQRRSSVDAIAKASSIVDATDTATDNSEIQDLCNFFFNSTNKPVVESAVETVEDVPATKGVSSYDISQGRLD